MKDTRTTPPATLLPNKNKPEFYEPAAGMLVLERVEFGKSEGGIVLPGGKKIGPPIAKVMGVGPPRYDEASVDQLEHVPCNVGDHILIAPSMMLGHVLDDFMRHRWICDFSACLGIVLRPRNVSIKMAIDPGEGGEG